MYGSLACDTRAELENRCKHLQCSRHLVAKLVPLKSNPGSPLEGGYIGNVWGLGCRRFERLQSVRGSNPQCREMQV